MKNLIIAVLIISMTSAFIKMKQTQDYLIHENNRLIIDNIQCHADQAMDFFKP